MSREESQAKSVSWRPFWVIWGYIPGPSATTTTNAASKTTTWASAGTAATTIRATAGSDIGTYNNDRLRSLSDEDRLWLLQNAFRPDVTIHKKSKKCSFQHAWLPWLCYFETCNGGFCINFALFAKHHLSPGQLVRSTWVWFLIFTNAKHTVEPPPPLKFCVRPW